MLAAAVCRRRPANECGRPIAMAPIQWCKADRCQGGGGINGCGSRMPGWVKQLTALQQGSGIESRRLEIDAFKGRDRPVEGDGRGGQAGAGGSTSRSY